MPVVIRKNIGNATLILWVISETEEELARSVTSEDTCSAGRFSSARRRREHLAWRAAVRQAVPDARIAYTETGMPFAKTASGRKYLGVAHTDGIAAVAISPTPCATDVENITRDFGRTSRRFVSPEERELDDAGRPDFEAAVWCAKEVLYKFSGRKELDFLKDLRITGADIADMQMKGRITDGAEITVKLMRFGDYMIAYII